jgi:hypothetical protein
MERAIGYLLQVVLVSGTLTAWYWIALRDRKWHGYNRVYLLGTLALGLVLPLAPLNWMPMSLAQSPVVSGTIGRMDKLGRAAEESTRWMTICFRAGVGVSGFLLALSCWRIIQVFRLKAKAATVRRPGYDFIETDDPRTPFSFMNNLFWRRDQDCNDPVNCRIIRHELAHIHGRHSWDSLFAQLACCICWINPFFWIIRRELTVVHEFIADAEAGVEGDTEGFARMLLQSMNRGEFLLPTKGFFQSPIKRRLFMITIERSPRCSAWHKAGVVPVILATLLFIACTKTPGSDAADQAKLQKQKLDLKLMKLARDGKLPFKLSAEDGKKFTLTPMEEKQQMELWLKEAGKQMQNGAPH